MLPGSEFCAAAMIGMIRSAIRIVPLKVTDEYAMVIFASNFNLFLVPDGMRINIAGRSQTTCPARTCYPPAALPLLNSHRAILLPGRRGTTASFANVAACPSQNTKGIRAFVVRAYSA